MQTHTLKLDKQYNNAIRNGEKLCEIRYNDRDYQKGDRIKFEIFDIIFEITHVLHFPDGLKDGYVALSIKKTQ